MALKTRKAKQKEIKRQDKYTHKITPTITTGKTEQKRIVNKSSEAILRLDKRIMDNTRQKQKGKLEIKRGEKYDTRQT